MESTFRPAAPEDIEAEHRVFCLAEGSLRTTHGYAWVDPPLAWFAAISRHLMMHDPDRCVVAEAEGRIVGFAAAFVREDVWFFSALFVDPEYQGQGIGHHLFKLAAHDAPARRVTITNAIQPTSNALYARYGLVPTTPLLLFEGRPSIVTTPDLVPGEADDDELAELDRVGYTFDRSVDHGHWSTQRACTVWRRDGQAVAYAYRSLTGSIGPLVGLTPSSAADALRAELARLHRASVEMPGTARSLVEVAVAARLRLVAPPGILLLSSGLHAPASLAISNYFLF